MLNMARLLRRLGLLSLIRSGHGGSLGGELLRDGLGVVRLVPLTEGRGVDLDDRALHDGVRRDEFVVRRDVDLEYSARYTFSEPSQGGSETGGTQDTDQRSLDGSFSLANAKMPWTR